MSAVETVTSLEELPFDDYDPDLDGDDSVHAPAYELGGKRVVFHESRQFVPPLPGEDQLHDQRVGVRAAAAVRAIPFKREIKRGSRGKDVVAVKRALSRARLMKWGEFTPLWGPFASRALKKFQESKGLRIDGVYGQATHKALVNHRYGAQFVFGSYEALLYGQTRVAPRAVSGLDSAVAAGLFGYHNRGAIFYTQGPWRMFGIRNHLRPPAIPRWEDCSSFTTWCYWVARIRDPNGLGYNGLGFTGTQASHGIRVVSPLPGDFAFYGPSPHRHVVMYLGGGRCVSHGSSAGPLIVAPFYRGDFSHWRRYV